MKILLLVLLVYIAYAGFCGNEMIKLQNFEKGGNVPKCGRNSCDDAVTRNTYSSSMNATINLFWIVFNCTQWDSFNKIRESTQDANAKYSDIKVTFKSYIYYYPCRGSNGRGDYTAFDQNKVIQAVVSERGQDFRKDKGIYIVTGTPSQRGLLGFMFFPGEQYSGIGFLNKGALGRGQKTLPHELGHALGLYHTFAGISEVSGCSSCYESNSNDGDNKGDFCQDTSPSVINWECQSPLAAQGRNRDQCNQQRTQWINPYENLMSYGECPNSGLTECQKKRIRCNYDKYLQWMK